MVGLRAGRHRNVLDLDEVADVNLRAQISARPQPGKGADPCTPSDPRALDMAIRLDLDAILDDDARPEKHVRFDDDIAPDHRVMAEPHRHWCDEGRAFGHHAGTSAALPDRLCFGKLIARVDAEDFVLGAHDDPHAQSPLTGDLDCISQIVFALDVGIADRVQDRQQVRTTEGKNARVA